MKRIILLLFIIISFQNLYADDFQLQKINEPYKTDFYKEVITGADCIYSLGWRALQILDIDNEGHLHLINELALYGDLDLLEINEQYAYMGTAYPFPSTGTVLYRINIENNNPVLVDSLFFPYPAYHIKPFKSHNYIFIEVTYSSADDILYIYDNESFELLAQYNIDNGFGCKTFTKINDDYAFGTDHGNSMLLHIYDISDIYNIHQIGDVDLTGSNVEHGWDKALNDSIFVFCNYHKFTFFDISNIIDWEIKLQIEFPDSNMALQTFAVLPNNRIVIPRFYSQDLYDISNISEPILLHTIECSWGSQTSCASYRNYYYGPSKNFGIQEFKLEDDIIEQIGKYPEFTNLRKVFKNNDNLVIETIDSNELHFFDISDIYNPQYICTHFEEYKIYGINFYGNKMAVAKRLWTDVDSKSIDVYDITDIKNPLLINSIDSTSAPFIHFANHDTLFTVEYYSEEYHFIKYDISELGTPDILFDFTLPSISCGLGIYGNYAYFRDEEQLYVIGNIESNVPEIINILNINEGCGLRIEGGYLLIFSYLLDIIELYNLTDPVYPFCEYVYSFEFTTGIGTHNNLVFAGFCDVGVYDLDNCSYYIEDPIYSFHTNFGLKYMIFFEENNQQYFYSVEQTCVTLYEYEYNNADVDDGMFGDDILSFTSYPNPFSTSTTISFSVTFNKNGISQIKIYNIKGQLVRELLPVAPSPSLPVSVTWDGTDETGKEVKSGVYFCKLDTKQGSYLRKILFLK